MKDRETFEQEFRREYPGRLRRMRSRLKLSEAQAAASHGGRPPLTELRQKKMARNGV